MKSTAMSMVLPFSSFGSSPDGKAASQRFHNARLGAWPTAGSTVAMSDNSGAKWHQRRIHFGTALTMEDCHKVRTPRFEGAAQVFDHIEDDPSMAAVHLTNHCVQVRGRPCSHC